MTAKQHIPKGYKQTEVGVIPEDWEIKEIRDIADIIGGGTPSSVNSKYWNGKINWFTPSEIGANKYAFESKRKITEEGYKNSSAKMLPVGSILLTSRAGIGDTAILRVKASTNQGFQSLITKDNFYNEYVYYLIYTVKGELLSRASGSTFLEISPDKLKSIKLPLPPKREQAAIARALSDMDALIEAQKKLIAKKRLIKQGAMQELLKPKKHWESKRLGEVAELYKGKGLSKSQLSKHGKHKCIHYGELFTKYQGLIKNVISKTDNSQNYFFFSASNDVLMPTSDVTPNGLATASCIKEDGVILGGDILVIRTNPNEVDGEFLAHFIIQNKHKIMKLVSGSTVYHLYPNQISNFYFYYPDLSLQKKASDIIFNLDSEIEAQEKKLTKYRQIKEGMMQELLTGKTRLI